MINITYIWNQFKQAGAEVGQSQVKMEAVIEVHIFGGLFGA